MRLFRFPNAETLKRIETASPYRIASGYHGSMEERRSRAGMTSAGPEARWTHPIGSLAWIKEAGLGLFFGCLVMQLATGLVIGYGFRNPGTSMDPIRWLTIHIPLGTLVALLVPGLVWGHPQKRSTEPDEPTCHDKNPVIRGIGFLTAASMGFGILSGLMMHYATRMGVIVPIAFTRGHATAAFVLAALIPIHILSAVIKRRRRWNVRSQQPDPRPPRFRGGWLPVSLWVVLAIALALFTTLQP